MIFSYFHISTCDQIWLNRFGDDSHVGIITKLEKETMPPTVAPKNSYYLLSFRGPIFIFSNFWCCVMCEHPKKDSANGDRFVEPFQDFFLLFLFSTLSNRWTDYYPKQEWAKFGWRSDKTIKNFKNPTLFSRPLRPPCLNMVTSNFFFSQNMMIFLKK